MAGGAAKTVLRAVQCPCFSCAIMKSFGAMFFSDRLTFLASTTCVGCSVHGSVVLSICIYSLKFYSTGSALIKVYKR